MPLVYLRNLGHLLTKDSPYCVWAHACNHSIIETESDNKFKSSLEYTVNPHLNRQNESKQTHLHRGISQKKTLFSDFYLSLYFFIHPASHSVSQQNKTKSKPKPPLAHNLPCHKERLCFLALNVIVSPNKDERMCLYLIFHLESKYIL